MATPKKASSQEPKSNGSAPMQHEGQFTEERSPQYNKDNESQEQIASSCSSISDSYEWVEKEEAMSVEHRAENFAGVHRPESHTTSTETAGSTGTVTGIGMEGLVQTASTTNIYPSAPNPALTEYTLGLYQRQLQQDYVRHIAGWIEGADPYGRFAIELSSKGNSMLARIGKSKASTTVSSMDWEYEMPPPLPSLSHDTMGIGAWA